MKWGGGFSSRRGWREGVARASGTCGEPPTRVEGRPLGALELCGARRVSTSTYISTKQSRGILRGSVVAGGARASLPVATALRRKVQRVVKAGGGAQAPFSR